MQYKIAFVDSGAGGLQFMLDVYRELEPALLHLQKQYAIQFIFTHIGDTLYAPYGNQSSATLKRLSHDLIRHAVEIEQAEVCMIACNTVSSLYESEGYVADCKLFPIISRSSEHLYKQAVQNAALGKPLNIGILSTAFTEKTQIYPTLLSQLAGNNAHIYSHVPESWVDFIESGNLASPSLRQNIQQAIGILTKNGSVFFDAVGLFCTHYPIVQKLIREAFTHYGQPDVCLVSQGTVFAQPLLEHIQQDIITKAVAKRLSPLDNTAIRLMSKVTGNVALMQSIADQLVPLQTISCERVVIEKKPDYYRENLPFLYKEVV